MKKWLLLLTFSFIFMGCGNNAEDTSGLVYVDHKVVDQTNPSTPTITVTGFSDINLANVTNFGILGTCSPDNYTININVGGELQTATCTSSAWSISGWDLSAVADAASVSVSVDLLDATPAVVLSQSGSIVKDTVAPVITIDPASDINPSNASNYALSGTCDEEGATVTVAVGVASASATCSSGVWSISAWNVSALSDGTGISVTANMSDAAGNPAVQATDSVDKDAIAPSVAITSPADGNYINLANDTATYSVSGTCNKNGQTVVIKVDGSAAASPVGFVCDGTNFSGTIDSTGLLEAALVLTAELTYNAQTATSANINLVKDVTAPTVAINTAADINSSNVSSYSISGTCSDNSALVSVNVGGVTNSTSCAANAWSISAWNVSSLSDGTGISVTADLNDAAGNAAVQATDLVDKDAVAPLVAISSPATNSYINLANDSATFSVSGTCNKNAQTVVIKVDGSAAASSVGFVCDGTNFSGTIDTTGLAEAALVMTAELTKDGVTGTSSNINLIKDVTIPVVAISSPSVVNSSNVNSYSLAGTCSENGAISIDVGGVTGSTSCSSNSWSISLNLSSVTDSASVAITANMDDVAGNSATQATSSLLKDTVLPTLAITSAPDINGSNHLAYSIVGSCSEEGRNVAINIGGLSFTPVCTSGSFTTGSVNVSSLSDAANIAVTADMSDAAGNNAVQATDTVAKDVAVPTVTIDIYPDISQANLTSYVVSGTCSENGRAVTLSIGGISKTPNCSSGTWSSGFSNVTSLSDGSVVITADHNNVDLTPAVQASVTINKDTAAPTVTISSAADITISNQNTYVVSGTCSENGRAVSVAIDTLTYTPTCSSGSWSTGLVNVSSLTDGSNLLVTADHSNASSQNAIQATKLINKATSTPTVSGLSVATAQTNSVDLTWSVNDPGGFIINDYVINYRVKNTSTWLSFNDGVSTSVSATVSSLNASTVYEFRVAVIYDTSNQSPWSNTAEGETQPDSPLFGANKAMNVGGATSSAVVAYQDGTNVTLNGSPLVTLNKGQTFGFTSAQFDVIDADKPIFTAGRLGSGSDTNKANIVWQPTSWAGKNFSFNAIRNNPQVLQVYGIEAAYVEVWQGATLLASGNVSADSGTTLTWSTYGSYQVTSTGTILAYHYSNQSGGFVDPKPLLPSSYELIGIPSSSMRLTADLDGTNYYGYHSDSFAFSGSLNKADNISYNSRGTTSLYQGESMLISADKKISGGAFADSNGLCTTPFLPTNLMKKKYAINVAATYVAFASKQAGTIQVLNSSDGVVTTLTLTRSGGNTSAPFRARLGTANAGYRFVSTVPIYGVYEPSTDTNGADNDETIMYGTDL